MVGLVSNWSTVKLGIFSGLNFSKVGPIVQNKEGWKMSLTKSALI